MDTETKIDKWFTGKIGFFIQITTLVVTVTIAIMAVKTDIALINKDLEIINTNHLTHIQESINEIKTDLKKIEECLQIILLKNAERD